MRLEFIAYNLLSDSENANLLNIRNEKSVRMGCENTQKIALSSHMCWVKSEAAKDYYAVKFDDEIIGGLSLVGARKSLENAHGGGQHG